MLLSSIVAFAAALLLSILLTHRVRGLARRKGWVDRPDGVRRLHDRPIPRVGGIAVFLSVIVVAAALLFAAAPVTKLTEADNVRFLGLMAGGAAVFALGLWDDLRGLSARKKFAVEALLAAAIYIVGFRIEDVALPGIGVVELPSSVSLPLTLIWIVGITNAFNLIDGSDGVAGGAAVFAAGSLAAVSALNGNELGVIVALTLAGAALGFLFFNFPPASVFLGDSGSLYLGFMLAGLGILTAHTASTTVAVAIPVVSFGLPILDTLLAMTRRFLRGERIFNPDRGHIHHRLRDLGHSPRKIALLLYAACAGFALLSLLLVQPAGSASAALLLLAGIVVWIAVQRLRIPELVEVGRIVEKGLKQRTAIAHNVRIREAVARVRAAQDAEGVLRALAYAFESGEFDRAELLLAPVLGCALEGCPGVQKIGRAWRWTWNARPVQPTEVCWEFRLPLRDPQGRILGRLSLWRLDPDALLLTDIRLIGRDLRPAIQRALCRLQNTSAAGMISEDALRLHHASPSAAIAQVKN
jgi:UDP-GlcNAc:undecaprenyl-phosphate GlcNAc-1-phosphate transferase